MPAACRCVDQQRSTALMDIASLIVIYMQKHVLTVTGKIIASQIISPTFLLFFYFPQRFSVKVMLQSDRYESKCDTLLHTEDHFWASLHTALPNFSQRKHLPHKPRNFRENFPSQLPIMGFQVHIFSDWRETVSKSWSRVFVSAIWRRIPSGRVSRRKQFATQCYFYTRYSAGKDLRAIFIAWHWRAGAVVAGKFLMFAQQEQSTWMASKRSCRFTELPSEG